MRWISDRAMDQLRSHSGFPEIPGGRYQFVGEIGRGGMGTVYEAEDRELGRHVAVKILTVSSVEPQIAARMLREARIIASLEHPGIVPVHDVGALPDGRIYYTMKLVRGKRLDELDPVTPLTERLRILQRICEAVGYAHSLGVIHRDLKPQNIMLGAFGEVLVMDWGVAKLIEERGERNLQDPALPKVGSTDTGHGTVLGTPGFMAPEQERGAVNEIDRRTDVYGLGAILKSLVTRDENAGIPRPLRSIMSKAMAAEQEARYPDAGVVALEIERFLDSLPVEAHHESLVERTLRWLRRYQAAVAIVVAYLALRIVLFFLLGR